MNLKKSRILLIFIFLFFAVYSLFLISENISPNYEISIATLLEIEEGNKNYILIGKADPETVVWKDEVGELHFDLVEDNYRIPVIYDKPMTGAMELTEVEIIVEGQYMEGIFYADKLQTRCPSKYEVK